ncbi:YfcC family protein [Candidatus Saccharibacteria bacterium]|nr:YfcC family protein [Candidatus Saccharibacteria bacterium]MBR2994631.1 YfcC family protein [Candidatus Saccharibacteria bacterium]MBR2994991.1 YfcC family protein [Candidatus Saccharibacteria bacterium]
MFRKKNRSKKRTRAMLSAYSIIMILIILLGILSHVLPRAKFAPVASDTEESSVEVGPGEWEGEVPAEGELAEPAVGDEVTGENLSESRMITSEPVADDEMSVKSIEAGETVGAGEEATTVGESADTMLIASDENSEVYESLEACEEVYGEEGCAIVDGSGVVGAQLHQVLMAPILGFADAIDVCIFIMMLGGLLAVVARTKALENGIKLLVQKLHGKEYLLIVLLMFIFSILGTTYGFLEESVGFYVLIAATMFAAGLDPLVGVATILLGSGAGVLGSTINPFATGVAISALKDAGIEFNQGTVILIAVVLWLTTLAIAAFFVIKYAKKVQRDKGSTFLSLREQAAAEKAYGKYLKTQEDTMKLSGKQIATLIVFGITFLVMIVGFVPWGEFGITFFDSWTGWLTGSSLGNWWFYEAALWFLICAIIIAIINRQGEHGFVDAFVDGADDMIGVILVIAVARGASVLMAETSMDNFIIVNAAEGLRNLPEMAFVPLNYLLHVVLSVLVPSSSGLATLSTPIIAPVAANLGYSTNVAVMTIVAANGLVNLITPTCGAIMGGLALAKVDYATWFKWGIRVVACIAVVNIIVLCLFSL